MITPSSSSALLKASADATASWPVIASQTKKTWCGLTFFSIWASSAINSSSTCKPAGRVQNQGVAAVAVGLDQGLLADRDRVR